MSPLAKRLSLPLVLLAAPLAGAQQADEAPLARVLGELGSDVQRYHEHVVYLASPFLDGRLPGTDGMEMAKAYCEFWLQDAEVSPGFVDASGAARRPLNPAASAASAGGRIAAFRSSPRRSMTSRPPTQTPPRCPRASASRRRST